VTDHLEDEQPLAVRPFAVTARRSGEVVASASGVIYGHRAVLDRLVVDAAHRRQGIGSHLLAVVQSLAAEAGCSTLGTAPAPGPEGEAFLRARGWTAGVCLHRHLGEAHGAAR
jgi:GNAT superfamily N-acetyltransferase